MRQDAEVKREVGGTIHPGDELGIGFAYFVFQMVEASARCRAKRLRWGGLFVRENAYPAIHCWLNSVVPGGDFGMGATRARGTFPHGRVHLSTMRREIIIAEETNSGKRCSQWDECLC